MKEIKIIDLLNMIAEGKGTPKKIKYNYIEYTFEEYNGEYGYVNKKANPFKWFIKEIDCDLEECLNETVEIIEEDNNKIEKLNIDALENLESKAIGRRVNQIIDKINDK